MFGHRLLAALCLVAGLWASPAAARTYDIFLQGTIVSADETNGTIASLGVGSTINVRLGATCCEMPAGSPPYYVLNAANTGFDLFPVAPVFSGGGVAWDAMGVPYAGLYPWGHIEPLGTYGPIYWLDGPQMILQNDRLVGFAGYFTAEPGPANVGLVFGSFARYTEIHDEVNTDLAFIDYEPSTLDPSFTIYAANGGEGGSLGIPDIRYYGQWDFAGAQVFIDGVRVSAPEPSTWALAIVGFGLVASRLRRYRTMRTAA
jgi:hypothetical protein